MELLSTNKIKKPAAFVLKILQKRVIAERPRATIYFTMTVS